MIRHLLCRKCGETAELHPEDKAAGFHARKVYVSVLKPEHHGITLNGVFHPMEAILCDLCSDNITGAVSIAWTMWRGTDVPRNWECEYGTVLPEQSVVLGDVLSGNEPIRGPIRPMLNTKRKK